MTKGIALGYELICGMIREHLDPPVEISIFYKFYTDCKMRNCHQISIVNT